MEQNNAIQTDKRYDVVSLSWAADDINAAIEGAQREYVAFSYKDVSRAPSAYFEKLIAALDDHPECAMAQGTLYITKSRPLSVSRHYPTSTTVLDSSKDFTYALIYPDGLVCRTDALKSCGARFDAAFTYCRDELFALTLADRIPKRLHVPQCKYKPGRAFDEKSQRTDQSNDPQWYWDAAGAFADKLPCTHTGELARTSQYGLLYLTILRLWSNENRYAKMVFADAAETERYFEAVSDIVTRIDDAVLFSRKPAVAWTRPRLVYLASLKKGDRATSFAVRASGERVDYVAGEGRQAIVIERFGSTGIMLQNLDLKRDANGTLGFEVACRFMTNFPVDSFEIGLRNTFEGGTTECKLERTPILASRMAFFNKVAYVQTLYKGFLPLSEKTVQQTITGFGVSRGVEVPLRIGVINVDTSRLCENTPDVVWSLPRYHVFSQDYRIEVVPTSKVRKALHEIRYIKKLRGGDEEEKRASNVRIAYWLTKPYFNRKRIWVYYDKGFKAGDNGEFAFRYGCAQDDGIDHVYYISPTCADGIRMKEEGLRVVPTRRARYFLYALNAEVIFCTHIPAYRTVGIGERISRYYKDLMSAKIVRIYHGFTLTHDPSYTQAHMNSMATVVGSHYEHDLYAEPVHGFAEDQIIDSGMPRHDGMTHDNQRQLLFAPTWRPTLRSGQERYGGTSYDPEFVQTRYFKKYHAIFTDERLLECARRTGYKIKLFLHPRLAPQTIDFKSNDVFEALDCTKDSDYVTMMRQSDLMVTDYSSVMIDFAYARKPVVYYQDQALPYWRNVDFDYKGIGFGEVCETEDDLIDVLCDYMEHDCALKDEYRKRIDDFFFYDDFNNSKRLYEAVRKMTD